MSIYSTGKHYLKRARWQLRRARVALQYGSGTLTNSPMIFGNAMPKSGSHLLTQILEGLTALGPFVDPGFPPVNRSEDNQSLSPLAVQKNLDAMLPGDIRYGYLHAEEPYLSKLTQPGIATIFIHRDPRDMIVSHVYYATDMYPGHGMYTYYNQHLSSIEERINAAIIGVKEPGYELSSVRQRYDHYRGWLDQPDVLSVKFEDLILDRKITLGKILNYVEKRGFQLRMEFTESVKILENSIQPKKSGTFRKGIPGNWREVFTDENIATFNRVAGNLLQEFGYGGVDDV